MEDLNDDASPAAHITTPAPSRLLQPSIGALTIDQILEAKIIGRTKLYIEINSGRLRAKKLGSKTIVLYEIWTNYLKGLPDYPTENS